MKINLDAVAPDPIELQVKGRTYKADPEMTAGEAFYFMKVMGGGDDAVNAEAFLPRWAAIISRCLTPHHAEMTPEQVMDAFSLREMVGIIGGFLVLNGQSLQAMLEPLKKQGLPMTSGPTTPEASP